MSGGGSSGSSQSQGFGSSYSNSASMSLPENMTSPYWQALAPYTMNKSAELSQFLGMGNQNPILQSYLAPFGGNFAAPVTDAQNTTLGNLGSAEGGNYSYNPTAQAEQQQLLWEMQNPTAFGQQLANGLPISPQLSAFAADPNAAGTSAANSLYATLVQTNPQLAAMLQPGYAASLASGQPTQSVIDAALAPIKSQFASQTVPGLQGSFAQAGQRGTGSGSSAFDMAFGNAQAAELSNEAATSGNIVNTVYNTGLNLQGTTANNVAGLEGGAFSQGYGASTSAADLLQSEKAALYGTGVNASLNAPSQLNSLNSSQIQDLIATLNAQALPQMTEQLGINNALASYNTNINSMLQALGLQIQAEQPVVGYASESLSNSGSFQNEESSGQSSSFNFGLPGLI